MVKKIISKDIKIKQLTHFFARLKPPKLTVITGISHQRDQALKFSGIH